MSFLCCKEGTIREVSRGLHVGVETVERLRQKYVSNVESSHGGRLRKMTPAMERSYVLDTTRGKLSTAAKATKNFAIGIWDASLC